MKHWFWYLLGLLAVAGVGGMPFSGSDVAQLQPVQVVGIEMNDGVVTVSTDTGDSGVGKDLQGAFQNLKDTTMGQVFLETAEYLLVSPSAMGLMQELQGYLRPGCGVCVMEADVDMEKVGLYLEAHPPMVTLQDCRVKQVALPRLIMNREGRMELIAE